MTFLYGAIPQYEQMFHGLSKKFISKNINDIMFYGPISLSLINNQADLFATSNGIIWEIQMDMNKPLNMILGIKTTSISRYSTEEEIILLNTRLPIVKTSIKSFNIDEDENNENKINNIKRKRILFLLNYLKNLNDIIKNKNKFYKKIGCQINDINNYIDIILKDDELYQLLFIKSSIKIANKNIYMIDRLIHELKLLFNINKFIEYHNELIIPSFSLQ